MPSAFRFVNHLKLVLLSLTFSGLALAQGGSIVDIDRPVNQTYSGNVWVGGWAMDPTDVITSVAIYVDGAFYIQAQLGVYRQDACDAIGNWPGCPYVGYDYWLNTAQFNDGTHTITVTATTDDGRQTSQNGTFSTSNGNPAPGTPYALINGLSGKAMDAPTQCVTNGCPIQEWDWNGGPQQVWSLIPADTQGFFSIVNQNSGRAVDASTGCLSNGCLLQQWDSNGGWQQQWTLVPTDVGGVNSIVNRLSGELIDAPTQCAANNGCLLQQWEANGGAQQQWQFVPQSGGASGAPPAGITVLVNGSFNDDPSWVNPSDPEYQAIAATFGDQPIDYQWSPNSDILPPLYIDIYFGASGFANFINSLNIPPSQTLSVVAHSHGGNIVKLASWGISHPINYLVTLGTPQNWDLPEINLSAVGNYCEVSSLADFVQVIGASPGQVAAYGYDVAAAGAWAAQEAEDLYYGNYDDALYDAEMEAYYDADAFYWFLTTKLAWGALNVMYTDLLHSDLHTAPVWANVSHDCGLSN